MNTVLRTSLKYSNEGLTNSVDENILNFFSFKKLTADAKYIHKHTLVKNVNIYINILNVSNNTKNHKHVIKTL